jgi:hypothetical protein
MKKISFLLLLFCLPLLNSAQDGLSRWGCGCILPAQGAGSWKIHFPYARVQLYLSPGGSVAGYIYKDDVVNLMFSPAGKIPVRVSEKDLAETALKGFCLKVYARENGFVKILLHSTGRGLWLSEKELSLLRYGYTGWMDFLIARKDYYHPVAEAGLNLREKPQTSAKKLTLLRGDHYEIVLTGNSEGLWAEAEVKKYVQRPCSQADRKSLKATEEYKGWLKLTDDSGYPNVWFYTYKCR